MKTVMPADEKAQFLLDVVEDRKAVDPVMLDLRGKTLMADFFLVCSGTSNVHIRAIADSVLEKSEEKRLAKPRIEGQENAEWVLIDFGDVILHVMGEEPRERYKLEQFWTTPQPKGALPPTPSTADGADAGPLEGDEGADARFFDEADQEVEPIDEDDLDDEEDDELDGVSLDELAKDDDFDEDEDLIDEDEDDDDEEDLPGRGPR